MRRAINMAALKAHERRESILELLDSAHVPLSGTALGRELGVSRQIIVGDIALLRERGHDIISTARGYLLNTKPGSASRPTRLFKLHHEVADTRNELSLIVELGGCVEDVFINHRAYGRVAAPLRIETAEQVEAFLNDIESGVSSPLLTATSGYHFHHVSAEREETLDAVEEALRGAGLLVDFMPYEAHFA